MWLGGDLLAALCSASLQLPQFCRRAQTLMCQHPFLTAFYPPLHLIHHFPFPSAWAKLSYSLFFLEHL